METPPLTELIAISTPDVIAELFDITPEQAQEFINYIKTTKP